MSYNMVCSECPTNLWYLDLGDAYDHGWSVDHCPKHATVNDEYPEYEVVCCMCQESGKYIDLQDAYDNGWFADECEFCPDHALVAIENSS